MNRKLKKEVRLEDLALMYGLDLEALSTAKEQAQDSPEKRMATAELTTLESIRGYLATKRQQIKYSGESFIVPLIRIP